MDRRAFLRAGGAGLAASLAGCSDLLETESAGREPPLVEDRPDAVYVPTHVEGSEMLGTAEAGRRRVGLMYSYPHRFWTVTGRDAEKVEIAEDDAVHLMFAVWDAETEQVLPVESGVRIAVKRDGETVFDRAPWPMLSQRMGVHFGDNVPLDGDGSYVARIDLGSTSLARFGDFEGEFEEGETVEIEFEYSESARNDLPFDRLEDEEGDRGAVPPADMEMVPTATAPDPGDLPGDLVGEGESGDATVAATATERGGEPYLAVSPRTPYRGYVLAMMSLSATVERDGDVAFDERLRTAIDPDLGYHYGAAVEGLSPDDDVTVGVDAPPQLSRHEGYETAFLDVPDVEL